MAVCGHGCGGRGGGVAPRRQDGKGPAQHEQDREDRRAPEPDFGSGVHVGNVPF
ncbi:hypothetical protein DA2_2031 [Desulfovibrio sp. A2]|nr:hypothetical protein DA2_2031 [Desulfovibrio sp. A2]